MHKLCPIVILGAAVLFTISLNAETLTLGSSGGEGLTPGFEDTHTVPYPEDDADTPHGESETLAVGLWGSKALIRFDVSSLTGKDITAAKLTLFCHWHPAEDREVSAHAVLVPWTAGEATWNEYAKGKAWQKPNAAGAEDRRVEAEDTFAVPGKTERVSSGVWDLTGLVKEWLAGTLPNNGVILEWKGLHGSPIVYRSAEFRQYNYMRLDVEYEGILSQMGLDPTFFAASDSLLDVTGRERALLAEKSGGAEADISALKAVINIKRYTLAHAELVIQTHFTAEALIGLRRTLDYTAHADEGDAFLGRYEKIARRQAGVAGAFTQLGVQFERVFPLVVAPPRNQLMDKTYSREHFEKLYTGSRDFVEVTAAMISRTEKLLVSSKAIESDARKLLAELGAGGGADWAPDSPLRTDIGFDRKTPVKNFDASGRPTSIIIGTSLGRSDPTANAINLDLQTRFRLDFRGQLYSGNYMNEKGEIQNRQVSYSRGSIPGDVIQPCGNHLGTMYCPLSLFARFKKEGRANELFDGVPYGTQTRGESLIPNWQEKNPKDVLSIQPVDYTLAEVWEAQREYLLKLGALYGDRPDINNIRIAWEPTNSWGTENDFTREQKISYLAEKGHTVSGRMQFQKRMKKKFGAIEKLNQAWRSSYKTFEELDPSPFFRAYPTDRKRTSPLFYEWELHRRMFFAEWLQHCCDALKEGGSKQPITVDIWAPSLSTVDNAIEPYSIASVADIVCSHDNTVSDSRVILLESIQHCFPEKLTGNAEYYWNGSDSQFSRTESVSTACARRNLWRDVAHGSSFFHAFTWTETQPYPGYVPASNYNLADYHTDFSVIRPSVGELQLQHAKLDALAHVFLDTQTESRLVAVYWPTASTINAMPLDVITLNREDVFRGIIPSMHSMLFDRSVQYRYVFEQAMLDGKEDLSGIKLLVLPYAAWLPEGVSKRLTAWVKAGGTLIAAGPFGAETVYGFEDGDAMREVFGKDLAFQHVDWADWKITSPARYAGKDLVSAQYGKGRVVMATSGFGLFHGKGNRAFWSALDTAVMRDAWCTTVVAGKLVEPNVDLTIRRSRDGRRYLLVTNLDPRSPVDITVGLKGHHTELVDLGVPGSVSFKPEIEGANTYAKLRLESGEGTAFLLKGFSEPEADMDAESMRTEVARLAGISDKQVGAVASLSREKLAQTYNELLDRGPVVHFEQVKPGEAIVRASFTKNMRLETSDAATSLREGPERVFGAARVKGRSLVLDAAGSGVSYTGEGYADANWGGSLASVIGRPFTVELEIKAQDERTSGTLFNIWYGQVSSFRIRIAEGGRLQVQHATHWWYRPPAFELTTTPCGVTDGKWHRITVTVPNVKDQAKGVSIYLDGRLLSSQTDPATHGSYEDDGPLAPGQMKGRPVIRGKVTQWGVGLRLDRVNVSTCSYIPPERLDTPLGRYRSLLVTQGVNQPGK